MKEKILNKAKNILDIELEALKELRDNLDDSFYRAIMLLLKCQGTIVVTGVGKSGIVGRKLSATLNGVGIPSVFLHPSESLHGDLGMIKKDDILIAISKSGQSDEFNVILPYVKRLGIPVIGITSNPESELARNSDVVIFVKVEKEACPYNIVPTSSTTAMVALGDAIALVLAELKGIDLQKLASLHPGGTIGKKYWLKVEDMMLTGPQHVPVVDMDAPMKEVILEMTQKRGITSVVDKDGKVVGVITDGDLRRLLEKTHDIFQLSAKDVMNSNPKIITKDELAATAAMKMEQFGITALIVIDEKKKPIGIIHLHDLMRAKVI
ncbi:MAG: KpsF/GutQ family sugar-phosphate isomerase [Candidatus Hydrothermia bacterium]